MKRILLLGANGQLGQELSQTLTSIAPVVGVGRERVDLTQPDAIRRAIAEIKPDVIVNAAAYTAVDKAEGEPELAIAINGKAPAILARSALELNAILVHFSTDYVFDGQRNQPYLETEKTNPANAYGESKLMGDLAIQQSDVNHIIMRTAWVYGAGRTGNFVKTMLGLGTEREEVRVVCDQIGSPTWTGDLAKTVTSILSQTLPVGIYNYTNSGVASWYDFAVAIFEEAKQLGFPLKVRRVVPIRTEQYPTPAKRPAYSVLSTAKVSEVLGTHPPHWRVALRQMLPQLLKS